MLEFFILLFIFTNVIDMLVTIIALREGLHEKNPLIQFVLKHTGVLGFIIAKVLIIILVIVYATSVSLEAIIILNILYIFVVLNNTLKLYIHREGP